MNLFDFDIDRCVQTLKGGGLILYPTDTVWGIGCDATNEKAVEKIYALKKRHDKKSMIILLADEKDIIHFAKPPSEKVTAYINSADKPVTVIYPQAKDLAKNLIAEDHTIAIRIPKNEFCEALISAFGKPVVSTSANISGNPSPENFKQIEIEILNAVDHVVLYGQEEEKPSTPSRIVKWDGIEGLNIIRN